MTPRTASAACWLIAVLYACAPPVEAGEGCDKNHFILDQPACPIVAVSDMTTVRYGHTASLLHDGRVLVSGGLWSSAEIFDPTTGAWHPAAPMGRPRYDHRAVVLADGRVLVVGGEWGDDGLRMPEGSAEIYDPAADTWTPAAPLINRYTRVGHTATLLADGRVLVVGGAVLTAAWNGWDNTGLVLDAEIYDPSRDHWVVVDSSFGGSAGHTATLLRDGRVLLAGQGWRGARGTQLSPAAEVFDPVTASGIPTMPLLVARSEASAVLLADGRVLVAGGRHAEDFAPERSTELYDPVAGTWSRGPDLVGDNIGSRALALPDGSVLMTGGYSCCDVGEPPKGRVERWTERAGWEDGPVLSVARLGGHTATLLDDGSVLIAGGVLAFDEDYPTAIASAERFRP